VGNASGGLLGNLSTVAILPMAPSLQLGSSWDPVAGDFVVADEDPNQLVAFDPVSGAESWSAPLPAPPESIVSVDPGTGALFVGLTGLGVGVFSAENGSGMGTLPGNATPRFGLSVDPSNHWLLLVDPGGNGSLVVWDVAHFPARSLGKVPPSWNGTIQSVFAVPSENGAWVVGARVGPWTTVNWVNFSTFQAGPSAGFGFPDPGGAAAVDAAGWLFLPDASGTNIQEVAPGFSESPTLGTDFTAYSAITVVSSEGLGYLDTGTSSSVGIVNLSEGEYLGTMGTSGPVAPGGLAVDPNLGTVFAPSEVNDSQSYLAELTPPSPPSNLTAVVGNASISLYWNASAVPFPAPVLGYEVERLLAGAGVGSENISEVLVNTTATSANLTGLTDGSNYSLQVVGVDATGGGTPSSPVRGTPVGVPYPPQDPSVLSLSGTELLVSWDPPAATDGSPVTGYEVQWSAASNGPVQYANTTSTSWPIAGLTPGTSYSIRIVALNAIGSSAPSVRVLGGTSNGGGALLTGAQEVAIAILLIAGVTVVGALVFLRRRGRPVRSDAPNPSELPEAPGET
jgi:hypothetical protein